MEPFKEERVALMYLNPLIRHETNPPPEDHFKATGFLCFLAHNLAHNLAHIKVCQMPIFTHLSRFSYLFLAK